jgi:6-phosphogluconate dehydrogenase
MNSNKQCELGLVGLGTMGKNLLLNMADHGFSVAGFDRHPDKVKSFLEEARGHDVQGASDYQTFIGFLRRPRVVMLLVPAGAPVDEVIKEILPFLQPGDLIIDAGNSYFKDTDVRARNLTAKNIQFLGVGISGGEEGARHGPSIMPGGPKEAYQRVRPVLEAVAAKVNNDPCVSYLGPGSAGHFVKMVHNGIEYGIMQLIAETYDLMKRGLGLNDDQLRDIYSQWNKSELNSYLIEITSQIFGKIDDKSDKRLIDEILSVAKQTGTGMWTSQSAMELQVPTPTIDLAVAMRDMSVFAPERDLASGLYQRPIPRVADDHNIIVPSMQHALFAGVIVVYAQGMELLRVASDKYKYELDLEVVSRIWRGGCIIRAALLEDICAAFHAKKDLLNLLLDPHLAQLLMANQQHLRQIVCQGAELGVSVPGLMASLSYLDAYRSPWSPANLIQAQRDYFGAHTYERVDAKGTFHTEWGKA